MSFLICGIVDLRICGFVGPTVGMVCRYSPTVHARQSLSLTRFVFNQLSNLARNHLSLPGGRMTSNDGRVHRPPAPWVAVLCWF